MIPTLVTAALLPFFSKFGEIVGLGGMVSIISYFIGAIFNGLTKADKDLIATLNKNLEERADLEAQQTKRIGALSDELERVQKIKRAEDNQIRELIFALHSKSPDVEQKFQEIDKKLEMLLKSQST